MQTDTARGVNSAASSHGSKLEGSAVGSISKKSRLSKSSSINEDAWYLKHDTTGKSAYYHLVVCEQPCPQLVSAAPSLMAGTYFSVLPVVHQIVMHAFHVCEQPCSLRMSTLRYLATHSKCFLNFVAFFIAASGFRKHCSCEQSCSHHALQVRCQRKLLLFRLVCGSERYEFFFVEKCPTQK